MTKLTLWWGLLQEGSLAGRCARWRAAHVVHLAQGISLLGSCWRHAILPLLWRCRVQRAGLSGLRRMALLLRVVSLVLRGLLQG